MGAVVRLRCEYFSTGRMSWESMKKHTEAWPPRRGPMPVLFPPGSLHEWIASRQGQGLPLAEIPSRAGRHWICASPPGEHGRCFCCCTLVPVSISGEPGWFSGQGCYEGAGLGPPMVHPHRNAVHHTRQPGSLTRGKVNGAVQSGNFSLQYCELNQPPFKIQY